MCSFCNDRKYALKLSKVNVTEKWSLILPQPVVFIEQVSMQDTVYFPCGRSVKSNFTFDLIFLIHEESEKIGFHFFFLQNLKWQPNENDR